MASSLIKHLGLLVGTSDVREEDKDALDRWRRLSDRIFRGTPDVEDGDADEHSPESVLHIYQTASNPITPLLAKLLSKSNVERLLEPLLSTLSSDRRDEDISAELAELIGFEDIELVMEIIHNRSMFVEALRHYRSSNEVVEAPGAKFDGDRLNSLSSEHARQRMEQKFRDNAARPLFSGNAQPEAEDLPHVYTSSSISGNVLSHLGTKYMLPIGTTRETQEVPSLSPW
ncbi:putative steryl acetyl hydrolase mug81 [Stygiomarasmius scandens]|uniref:Steryl acetyl hydrolase mug81 n=1 Tax=Marasmiellus scandens TaxID=2682957 RepID=A0ABR1K6P7_9AGAR